MHYVSVDDAIRHLIIFSPGALMAKFDVEAAYRNIFIHPADRYLLGMRWRDHYFIDLVCRGLDLGHQLRNPVAPPPSGQLPHNRAP